MTLLSFKKYSQFPYQSGQQGYFKFSALPFALFGIQKNLSEICILSVNLANMSSKFTNIYILENTYYGDWVSQGLDDLTFHGSSSNQETAWLFPEDYQ